MVTTQHTCAKCGSAQIQRNGHSGGHARYRCTDCGHQARFVPAAAERAARYGQVEKLLAERNSQRSIVRVTGVSRMTVAKLAKKAQQACPALPRLRPKKAQQKRWEALELDEMWTFVGRKRRKVWLWLAVERASRRVVAWVLGRRDAATARRLWQALPPRYRRHCWYFTDLFPAYAQALPTGPHRPCPKGEGQTNIVEALNCSLRQRCGVFGAQILLLQQIAAHARGANQNLHRPAQSENHPYLDHRPGANSSAREREYGPSFSNDT